MREASPSADARESPTTTTAPKPAKGKGSAWGAGPPGRTNDEVAKLKKQLAETKKEVASAKKNTANRIGRLPLASAAYPGPDKRRAIAA